MKLILDMNLSPQWVDALAVAGFEATHWSALGDPGAADSAIMAFARARDAVILTHDLDFGTILAASGGNAPSVVQLRFGALDPASAIDAVTTALGQFRDELDKGALLTLDVRRSRVSLLPLDR